MPSHGLGGTDGNIISFDASGDPVAIATGTDGQVLTSTGAGSPPAFEAVSAGFTQGTAVDATGTAITFGNAVEFDSAPGGQSIRSVYDSNLNKVIIFYTDSTHGVHAPGSLLKYL